MKEILLSFRQKPVLLLGLGGHAKVLINILRLCGREIKGALSQDSVGTKVMDVPVIGNDDELDTYEPNDIELVNALGHLPNNNKREILFKLGKQRGFTFTSVIHPSVIVAEDVKLGEGVQVMAGVILEPAIDIGRDSIINTSVSINHDAKIGQHTHLAPGVLVCGNAYIGDGVFIGSSSSVMPGIIIEDNVFIKANSLVKNDKLVI